MRPKLEFQLQRKIQTWKKAAFSTVVMELVPLSITLSTSPVFLDMCQPRLSWWMCLKRLTWVAGFHPCQLITHLNLQSCELLNTDPKVRPKKLD